MAKRKKPENAAKTPGYFEYLDKFEQIFRSLCVDYAFVEEFLSRENLLDVTDPSTAQQAAYNIFWTYSDSLHLSVAKLADGGTLVLSPRKFITDYERKERWQSPDYRGAFDEWKVDLSKWIKKTETRTLLLFRDEHLAHNLAKGGGDKRNWKGPYKNFEGNPAGHYLGTGGEIPGTCKEGITLLARLMTLCGRGRNIPSHFGFKEAAEGGVAREIKEFRRLHSALLELL